MLRNYLKIAYRNLKRRKGYAFINITGLAVGLAACLLIALWVRYELSYDRFHENADRLYRVVYDVERDGEEYKMASTQAVLAPTVEAELPAIEEAVRLKRTSGLVRYGEQSFYEDHLYYSDPEVLEIFSFSLLQGDPSSALAAPGSIVLSEKMARKYFGDANPLGETLISDKGEFTVTGVLEEIPENSHLQFDALISISTVEENDGPHGNWRNWSNFRPLTYVLLEENASEQAVETQMGRLVERYAEKSFAGVGESMEELGLSYVPRLEPMADVHLYSEYGGRAATKGIRNVLIFSLMALFILAIACVNYTNLATAHAARRAKEVGVRKTVGAQRSGLASQFLTESVLLSLLGGVIALSLARIALPAFEQLSGSSFGFLSDGELLVFLAIVIGVGLLAGAYPALVLSRYQPTEVLKGSVVAGRGKWLRKGLVVVQFGIAIALIASTAVVFSQLGYMQRQDLGFAMNEGGELMTINFGDDPDVQEHLTAVKRRLLALPSVTGVAASSQVPADGSYNGGGGDLERPNGETKQAPSQLYMVDDDFFDLYGINLIAGRDFSEEAGSDTTREFIFNKTAVQEHGFSSPQEMLGRYAKYWGQEGQVVGVVEDFHVAGLRQEVAPMALLEWPAMFDVLTLRVKPEDVQEYASGRTFWWQRLCFWCDSNEGGIQAAIADIRTAWNEIAPGLPFEYTFVDEQFAAQYRAEARFGRIFGIAAGLAIFIACLGLFGLAAFTAQQRTKEIGIRKVLGAPVANIVMLLSKDFLKLVGIAFVIAVPAAYFVMQKWLEDFAYRIELGIGVFAFAGVLAVLIALATVSYQAVRAALADPVNALRAE